MHYILIFLSFMTFFSTTSLAANKAQQVQVIKKYNQADYDREITAIFAQHKYDTAKDLHERLIKISAVFLGKPYHLGPLGEGPQGSFNKNPLYRTDRFDCVTYVSTVLALSHARDLNEFKRLIKKIRYQNGDVKFVHRNHFMTVDWNPTNTRNGYIKDVTDTIVDKHGKPIAQVADTIINKPGWYQAFKLNALHVLQPQTPQQAEVLLAQLHQQSKKVLKQRGVLLYLPLSKLFDKKGQPRQEFFKQIPNASIIEIVRPNWNLKDKIGTNMHVSHLGFAFRDKRGLIYREASLLKKKVIDVPLSRYLKKYLQSPTVKGINVQQIINRKLD